MATLLKSQKNIATHDNGDMADDAVKIPQLGFSLKVEVMFHHLEKHLDIPPFAVDADDFLVGQVDLGRQNGQPLPFMAVADKDDSDSLLLFGFNHHAGLNPGLTQPLLQLGEELAQGQPLPLMPVKYLRHILAHADHRQLLAQGGKESGKGKPAVHQKVVGPDASRQHPFHHGFQMTCGFGHGFHPALVAAAALVHLLLDPLQSLARLGRGAQDEIERQETHPIGPAQGQEFESLQAPVGIVIVYPGQQLNHLGAGPVIGTVVDDQHLLALFAGQHIHEADHHRHQAKQELPPVIPGILQELVGGILLESQFRIVDDAPEEVESAKRQGEDGGEYRQRLCPSQLADPAVAQQGADLTIFQEGRNPAMQSFCLLLLLVVLGMIHSSLFFLILLKILANPMYQKAKGFSR